MDGRQAAATLGVSPQATKSEVRRAFRALVKRAHPDAAGHGSDAAFIALRTAFECLITTAPDDGPTAITTGPRSAAGSAYLAAEPPRFDAGTGINVVDLTTATSRQTRRSGRPAAGRGNESVGRDHRGMTFGDHLSIALAKAG